MPTTKIWFATNREPNRKSDPDNFGRQLAQGVSDLRFGSAKVEETANGVYRVRKVKTASEKLEGPGSGALGSHAVFEGLRKKMVAGADALIFVHGFNYAFKEALEDAARLKLALERAPGAREREVVVFTWPSDGEMIPRVSYFDDRRDAQASGASAARALAKFRDYLADLAVKDACRRDVNLIAHSMGNFALRHAVQRLSEHVGADLPRLFAHVFLMAADEDDDALELDDKLRPLAGLTQKVHIYCNAGDAALKISTRTKGNPARLGYDGPRNTSAIPDKMITVDCTNVIDYGSDEQGHHYYLRNPLVLADMNAVMAHQAPEAIANRAPDTMRRGFRLKKPADGA